MRQQAEAHRNARNFVLLLTAVGECSHSDPGAVDMGVKTAEKLLSELAGLGEGNKVGLDLGRRP